MSSPGSETPSIREAVASFASPAQFRDAAARLLADGFKPTDLSMLATHESLEVAGNLPGYAGSPGASLVAGLTDDAGYLMPLAIAGAIFVSGGPIAAALAALAGAGIGGAAIGEVIARLIANRHSAAFATALQQGGVLLWVQVKGPEREAAALRILQEAGGRDIHVNTRGANPPGAPA